MARILVIDDEELARFTIREFLESAGHQVEEAVNGRQGVDLQRRGKFDLVITDVIMPEKEGVETTIELKREFPGIKVIAISGGGRRKNFDFLKLAQQFGADATLQKPFTRKDLMDAVGACLAYHSPITKEDIG